MALSPELEAALQVDLPTHELVKILRKYHAIPPGDYYCELLLGRQEHKELKEQSDMIRRGQCPPLSYWKSCGPLMHFLPWPPWSRTTLRSWSKVDDDYETYQHHLYMSFDLRKATRKRLLTWLCNPDSGNICLIFEPCLDYQVPVTDAVVQICRAINRLGAITNLVSWPEPRQMVKEICSQLLEKYPPYRKLFMHALVEEPTIFDKGSFRSLLRKLIFEPWSRLSISYPQYVAAPPVVFLDLRGMSPTITFGLLRSIAEDRLSHGRPSLLWAGIVNCQWDSKLSTIFIQEPQLCRYVRDLVGSDEAREYTEAILRLRFQDIRRRYINIFHKDEIWPQEDELRQIARVVSGVELFIKLLIRFIDLADDDGPRERLKKCIAYIDNAPTPTPESPYNSLMHFYHQFLSDLPLQFFPHAIHVLEHLLIHFHFPVIPLTPSRIAHLVGTDQENIHQILSHLQWTLHGGESRDSYAPHELTYNLHTGIRQLLHLSKQLRQTLVSDSRITVVEAYLNSFKKTPLSSTKPRYRTPGLVAENPLTAIKRITGHLYLECTFLAFTCVWASRKEWNALQQMIEQFDFRHWVYKTRTLDLLWFPLFLKRLHKVDNQGIVRTKASSILDCVFIDKCIGIAEPLNLEIEWQDNFFYPYEYFRYPKFVLLGYGLRTVLVIMLNPGELGDDDVSIYTLGMLEDL